MRGGLRFRKEIAGAAAAGDQGGRRRLAGYKHTFHNLSRGEMDPRAFPNPYRDMSSRRRDLRSVPGHFFVSRNSEAGFSLYTQAGLKSLGQGEP